MIGRREAATPGLPPDPETTCNTVYIISPGCSPCWSRDRNRLNWRTMILFSGDVVAKYTPPKRRLPASAAGMRWRLRSRTSSWRCRTPLLIRPVLPLDLHRQQNQRKVRVLDIIMIAVVVVLCCSCCVPAHTLLALYPILHPDLRRCCD